MPATRQHAYASCILLRPRSPLARLAKILRELGRPSSAPATPHENARLCKEVALRPRLVLQRHCRMPHALITSQLSLRHPVARIPATRHAALVSSTTRWRGRASVGATCSLVFFTPLEEREKGVGEEEEGRQKNVRPLVSSFRPRDEADDGSACLDRRSVPVAQDGLEGVLSSTLFGSFVASRLRRAVSSRFAHSALVRCALHFVTESLCASSPMSRKHSQIRRHTSVCGLRPLTTLRSTLAHPSTNSLFPKLLPVTP